MSEYREYCRFVVPVDLGDASPNKLKQLRQKMRVTKAHREAAFYAWVAAGKPVAPSFPIRLDMIVRRGRAMDDDNLIAAAKRCRDGFCKQRLVPDDSSQYVKTGNVEQVTGKQWKLRTEVEFIVMVPMGEDERK